MSDQPEGSIASDNSRQSGDIQTERGTVATGPSSVASSAPSEEGNDEEPEVPDPLHPAEKHFFDVLDRYHDLRCIWVDSEEEDFNNWFYSQLKAQSVPDTAATGGEQAASPDCQWFEKSWRNVLLLAVNTLVTERSYTIHRFDFEHAVAGEETLSSSLYETGLGT